MNNQETCVMTMQEEQELHKDISGLRKLLITALIGIVLGLVSILGTGFVIQQDHDTRLQLLEAQANIGQRYTMQNHIEYAQRQEEIVRRLFADVKANSSLSQSVQVTLAELSANVKYLSRQIEQMQETTP